jgi:hypothetical protein
LAEILVDLAYGEEGDAGERTRGSDRYEELYSELWALLRAENLRKGGT